MEKPKSEIEQTREALLRADERVAALERELGEQRAAHAETHKAQQFSAARATAFEMQLTGLTAARDAAERQLNELWELFHPGSYAEPYESFARLSALVADAIAKRDRLPVAERLLAQMRRVFDVGPVAVQVDVLRQVRQFQDGDAA